LLDKYLLVTSAGQYSFGHFSLTAMYDRSCKVCKI